MKKKILILADSPLAPSGVGTQTKYMIEALLKTGKYSFTCIAGAIKHRSYESYRVDPYGDDWVIHPVDGYGSPALIRSMLQNNRPDMIWFMTDPRFWTWLWEMEHEIRSSIPMVYYHVWDNYPYPEFNRNYYLSNDLVCTISKVTDDIVKTVAPEVKSIRIPHTVDTEVFKNLTKDPTLAHKVTAFREGTETEGKVLFFWNNRNARRKQSGTLIFWFKEFLDKVGHDKAALIMHTEPGDPHGQDLVAILNKLDLQDGQVQLSVNKVPPSDLAVFYSAADCTINISDAEGFGLSTLESLACETPIIVTMTGGLQEQVTDGKEWFGEGIEPSSKTVIGSQDVPYIHEDRISKEDFLDSLERIFNKTTEERAALGLAGRNHVLNNYGLDQYGQQWSEAFDMVFTEFGSWETRKNYNKWELLEL